MLFFLFRKPVDIFLLIQTYLKTVSIFFWLCNVRGTFFCRSLSYTSTLHGCCVAKVLDQTTEPLRLSRHRTSLSWNLVKQTTSWKGISISKHVHFIRLPIVSNMLLRGLYDILLQRLFTNIVQGEATHKDVDVR